jgi:O-antigen/teichoic acid export membrane protein
MQAYYDVMVAISYVVVVPIALLASPLVTLLYGAEYSGSGRILAVHVWALVFVSIGSARTGWIVAENLVRYQMLATLLGALVNVGLNYVLIPRYAGLGAAWATVASQAVAAYLSCLVSRRLWPTFAQMTRSLLLPFRLGDLRRALREAL